MKNTGFVSLYFLYNQRIKFSERILKEYSIFYLVIDNLNYFYDKTELISEIKFSTDELKELKNELISYLTENKENVENKLETRNWNLKFSKTIETIIQFAPVKSIVKNKSEKDIINIFYEILDEIKKIEMGNKIHVLEAKVAKKMDEKLYAELLSLKSHLKRG